MRQKVRRGSERIPQKGWTNMGQNATEKDGQKNGKCNMGFDSDTFSRKNATAEKLKVGQK